MALPPLAAVPRAIASTGSAPVSGPASMAVPVAAVAAVSTIADASRPILPQRMTASGTTAGPDGSVLRHWPIAVIVLAVITILGAVALLTVAQCGDGSGKHPAATNAGIGPLPDRMDTNPMPEVTPPSTKPPVPTPPPPPKQPATKPDLNDPWSNRHSGGGGIQIDPDPLDPRGHGAGTIPDFNDLLRDPSSLLKNQDPRVLAYLSVARHACAREEACGNSLVECSLIDALPDVPPPTCDAAQRCIERTDALTCDQADAGNMDELFKIVPDCVAILQRC